MNELKNDTNLREAVSRREQQLPPMPADLNERLMQRLEETEAAPKARRLWLYTASALAVAASITLLIVFHLGKEQTPQEPLVAQQTVKQDSPQPTPAVSEVVEAPEPVAAEVQTSQKPVKKQRKVIMKLVELIPTSEAKSANVKELPASLIDKVKAYEQASDPSRTTGIDDIDPLVAMAAQVEDIRQRGQRLQQEIDNGIDN